jgi:hypothetical protein
VPAWRLVQVDSKPVPSHPALKLDREEAVVATLQDLRRDIGPCGQRPWLPEWRRGLLRLTPREHLGLHDGRDVVKERFEDLVGTVQRKVVVGGLLGSRLGVAGVDPPLPGSLAGRGDHRVHEHQQGNRDSITGHRPGEPGHRLGDHDDVGPIPDRVDDGRGVLGEAGRVVAGGQFDRDDIVAALTQFRLDQVPVEGAAAGTGDQHERRAGRRSRLDTCAQAQ